MKRHDKRPDLWKAGTFVFLVLFIISLLTGGFGIVGKPDSGERAAAPTSGTPEPSPNPPSGEDVSDSGLEDDDPFLGDENAPVVMIEFSDFQCPFCKRFRDQTFDQIKSQYIDTGKVKFVYRDFPLNSIHPYAQKSAEAAECADDQGKFWEYHDKLFENQQVWSSVGISEFKKYAQELGLDEDIFNSCLDSGKYTNEVNNDLSDAAAAGGRGTPFFIIGNTPLSGAQPFSVFQAAIEAELNS
jgi:protein-disulfide isomerase